MEVRKNELSSILMRQLISSLRLLIKLDTSVHKVVRTVLIFLNSLTTNDFLAEDEAVFIILVVPVVIEVNCSLFTFDVYHFLPIMILLMRLVVAHCLKLKWITDSKLQFITPVRVKMTDLFNDQALEIFKQRDALD